MGYEFIGHKKRTATIVILICSLLICTSTIAGLTYALFTSDDEDGKIGINVTTGKVQVDIVDTENNSLIGDVLDFVVKEEKEDIYFEPGSVYYTEGFEVKNIGTVPVNFHVYISEDEDVNIKKFAEAFELWITTDPKNQESAEKLTEFTGRLEIGEMSKTYYLVIRMKESAGNEFQNKTYTGIGVTVYAVQGNADIGSNG